ncbi:hypothetical protein HML84_07020 [Alcanivorax sp. IO_7]|nr:hypothetical protein HML84_07020 [Alcanivorax sp. IO_7]
MMQFKQVFKRAALALLLAGPVLGQAQSTGPLVVEERGSSDGQGPAPPAAPRVATMASMC